MYKLEDGTKVDGFINKITLPNGKTVIACTLSKKELETIGEKAFRAKQIYEWLHVKLVDSFEEMTNLSKALREKLSEAALDTLPRVEEKLVSKIDGTVKYLFSLSDGNCV